MCSLAVLDDVVIGAWQLPTCGQPTGSGLSTVWACASGGELKPSYMWYPQIAGLVYQSFAGAAPAYLADDCCLLLDAGRWPLRSNSNDMRKLFVPRTHNKLGDRSFSAAGPRLWNNLPPGLRWPGLTFDSFKKSLKTHPFGDQSAQWLIWVYRHLFYK